MAVVFFYGLMVSFLGQLPLGNMSFTATQVRLQEGNKQAWLFAIGVAIVEMIYLRFALTSMDWVVQHQLFFTILGWVTVALFLSLGVMAFVTAKKQHPEKKALVLNNRVNRFVLGLTMSALNPLQLPFWFLWTSTFIQAKLLPVTTMAFHVFTIGAGSGTLLGLAVYIHGGNWLVTKMKTSNQTLNKAMGIVFIVTACLQLYRMMFTQWMGK